MTAEKSNSAFYVSGGLLTPEHHRRMGSAVWAFLWLVSHETREGGKVLNGSPVTAERIASALGQHVETVKHNLGRLEREGYITRFRHHGGLPYEYQIANSKKWKALSGGSENTSTLTAKTLRGWQRKHFP